MDVKGSTDEAEVSPRRVDFYFDPLCPWAYHASLWIREVRDLEGIEVAWRFFSLEEINRREGKKHPWEREWSYGWSLMRIGALLRRTSMEDLDLWYRVIGEALHEEGVQPHRRNVAEDLAEKAGFGRPIVASAIDDPSTSDEVKAEHEDVAATHGAFGVPTLVFPSKRAVFGPKIAPAPAGEDARKLWRLVCDWASFDGLYELKRPQLPDDMARIASVFKPYLAAREWQTVENPAPGS